MNQHFDFEFDYKGHTIQIALQRVPAAWMGDPETIVTVLIDGHKTVVPGIWRAYHTHGEEGVKMVIRTYLDGRPSVMKTRA